MQEPIRKYLQAFRKLRVDRSHGIPAPHKPILLLSVLQLYKNGIYTTPQIFILPELVAMFKTNWKLLVESNHDCRISYPFYYLKSAKFWRLVPKSGFENIDQMGSIMKTFSNLNAAVEFALIDEDLFQLMRDDVTNAMLRQVILDEYFPETQTNFFNPTGLQQKIFEEIEDKLFNEPSGEYKSEIERLLLDNDEEEIFLRGSLFKREIPKIYGNTCCISGMRVDAIESVSMIDACHIKPFSQSYDDTVTNGFALCPNLHRAFDRGLISIDDNYHVIISNTFREEESIYGIKIFEGRQITLPNSSNHYPNLENFRWHRENVLK